MGFSHSALFSKQGGCRSICGPVEPDQKPLFLLIRQSQDAVTQFSYQLPLAVVEQLAVQGVYQGQEVVVSIISGNCWCFRFGRWLC